MVNAIFYLSVSKCVFSVKGLSGWLLRFKGACLLAGVLSVEVHQFLPLLGAAKPLNS
jgi:hypothetical protein